MYNTIIKHTQSITELDAAVTEAWTLQMPPLRQPTPALQAPKQTPMLKQVTPAAQPLLQQQQPKQQQQRRPEHVPAPAAPAPSRLLEVPGVQPNPSATWPQQAQAGVVRALHSVLMKPQQPLTQQQQPHVQSAHQEVQGAVQHSEQQPSTEQQFPVLSAVLLHKLAQHQKQQQQQQVNMNDPRLHNPSRSPYLEAHQYARLLSWLDSFPTKAELEDPTVPLVAPLEIPTLSDRPRSGTSAGGGVNTHHTLEAAVQAILQAGVPEPIGVDGLCVMCGNPQCAAAAAATAMLGRAGGAKARPGSGLANSYVLDIPAALFAARSGTAVSVARHIEAGAFGKNRERPQCTAPLPAAAEAAISGATPRPQGAASPASKYVLEVPAAAFAARSGSAVSVAKRIEQGMYSMHCTPTQRAVTVPAAAEAAGASGAATAAEAAAATEYLLEVPAGAFAAQSGMGRLVADCIAAGSYSKHHNRHQHTTDVRPTAEPAASDAVAGAEGGLRDSYTASDVQLLYGWDPDTLQDPLTDPVDTPSASCCCCSKTTHSISASPTKQVSAESHCYSGRQCPHQWIKASAGEACAAGYLWPPIQLRRRLQLPD